MSLPNRLQPHHVVTVLEMLIASTSARILSGVGQCSAGTERHGDVLAAEHPPAQSCCLTAHCCAWLFGLLACLDSVMAQQASIASDLRLLFRLAVYERHQIAVLAAAPSRFASAASEEAPAPTLTAEQKRTPTTRATMVIAIAAPI